MPEISFSVAGLPPAKNEAKSMLAPGHVYAKRVLALLRAARDVVGETNQPLFPPARRCCSMSCSGPKESPRRTQRTTSVASLMCSRRKPGGGISSTSANWHR